MPRQPNFADVANFIVNPHDEAAAAPFQAYHFPAPPANLQQPEQEPQHRGRGARGMPTLQEKLVQEYENLNRDRPYVPYGAYLKREAERLRGRQLRHRPGQKLTDIFSPEQLQLILSNDDFAQRMLSDYMGRGATARSIKDFRNSIVREHPEVFPNGRPLPQEEQYFGRHDYLPPGQQRAIREVGLERIAENANLESQAQRLLQQSSRLAPLNPLHNEAKAHLRATGQRGNESLRLAEDEIRAANRLSVPREIAPYLAKASESPAAFLRQYEMDYAPVIAKYREEAAKDFLENDLPTINNHFASKGAFYSGARMAALDKAKADKERRMESDIVKMLTHGREEGMKHYHEHRSGTLKQAEIAGHGKQAEQDARLRGAEALRLNSATGHVAAHQHATALGQMGRTEQEQAQNELNVLQQEYEKERERPYMRLSQKAQIAGGLPSPNPQLSAASMNPPPPNVYGGMAGLIGQMAGLMGQPQQQQQAGLASGGHVRQGYAAGDSVSRAANQLQQMQQHIPSSPEEQEMRQAAQNFKNHRANPMADYLFAAGSHQLANLHEDPMKTFGQGSQLGMQAFKSAQGENLNAAEKYHNLIGKINQTKMDQHQFLARYHSQMQQQEEMVRQHNAHNAETRRAHDMLNARMMDKSGEVGTKPVKMSATEKKLEHDAQKDLLRGIRMQNELGRLNGLVEQTSTGPGWGILKSTPLTKTKTDNQIETITNKLILDMHQGMKNIPRSEEFMKRIETTKPNRFNYPEANKQALEMMHEGANDVMEHSISSLLSAGWTPEKIEKRFKIKVPKHLLEGDEEIEEETSKGSEAEGDNGMVSMLSPDGQIGMIPKSQIEAAIAAGGKLA